MYLGYFVTFVFVGLFWGVLGVGLPMLVVISCFPLVKCWVG